MSAPCQDCTLSVNVEAPSLDPALVSPLLPIGALVGFCLCSALCWCSDAEVTCHRAKPLLAHSYRALEPSDFDRLLPCQKRAYTGHVWVAVV